jgi:hypothetical protein
MEIVERLSSMKRGVQALGFGMAVLAAGACAGHAVTRDDSQRQVVMMGW